MIPRWSNKLIRLIRNLIPKRANKNSNINIKTMAKKTVITKVLDTDAQDGIIEFPQNRTLYVDQFTSKAPTRTTTGRDSGPGT